MFFFYFATNCDQKILSEKIDNVECLLHVLLNCPIFQIIFSKNRFSKKILHFFAGF
jgi:hypothetical protein